MRLAKEGGVIRRPLFISCTNETMVARKLAVEFDEKKIDAIFADLDQCHLPGAAVGIAIGGKPVYRKGFGLASMELPVVLSPSIRMRIGSTTKHFTCLAYMLLCEEGKAGIDDPIGKFLPELHPVTHDVTMRQLMGHTSGLRDAFDINWQFSGTRRAVSSADVLSFYRDIDDVNFAPGTAWSYSNGGYLLLSFAVERLTRQSLEEVMCERIFEPAGMHDTLLRRFDTDFVPNSATLHPMNPAGGYEKSYIGTASAGEGGIASTADDILRWLAHMDAPWVGSAATWTLMKAAQTLANGTSTGYGLGLHSGRYRGVETLWHAGGVVGGNSQMLKVPAADLDVAVMVNSRDVSGEELANKIFDACLPNLDPVKEASSRPLATGIFRSPTTGRVIQLRTSSANHPWIKEGQQIATIDGFDIPVEPDDDGVLSPAGTFGSMKLGVTLGGNQVRPASVRFSDFGNVDDLAWVPPVDDPDMSAIVGRYRSSTTGTDATICETSDGPWLSTIGRFGSAEFKLECLANGIWRAKSTSYSFFGGILLFDGDGGAFRFSSLRTRALRFRRCT
jgi:D-aminopeptidase